VIPMPPDAPCLATDPPKEGLADSLGNIADAIFRLFYDLDCVFDGLGTEMGLQLAKRNKSRDDADLPLIMSLVLRAFLFGLPGLFMTYILPPFGAILYACFFTVYIYKRTKFLAEEKAEEVKKT